MNRSNLLAVVLVLWAGPAWSASLVWDPDPAPNLAGYRVYQCSTLPCTPTSGNASLLVSLGTVTNFNIGTPSVTEYYFVTAYNLSNIESGPSNLATFAPAVAPPPVVSPAIGASPTSLAFTATQGGANPTTQALNISNTGGGTLNWTASGNATWLKLSPASGTGNGAVTLSVATSSLTAGTYSAIVTMSATGTSSVTVPVTFTVTSPQATPTPPPAPAALHITSVN